VRVLGLPGVAELGDRSVFACGDEDRIEAEPLGAARLVADAALEDAGAAQLLPLRREGNELADVAGSSSLEAHELSQQPFDVHAAREAGGLDPGRTAQAFDLEA
jgi:hypothetical protein